MTGKRTLTRLVPAALLVSVALMACNHQGTPPSGSMNALVLGQVQSPYFDALKPNLNVVQYTGTQNVDDYDMIVFDGDTQSPQSLQANPQVEQAVRDGKWVLGLDVTEDHKRTGFSDRLGAVNRGTSPGWMVRVGSDANGRTEVRIVDAPKVQAPLTATPLPGGILGDSATQLNASTNAYASTVMSQLHAPRAPLPSVGDNPVPSNLLMATYIVSSSSTVPFTATYKTTGDQTAYVQYNYTFKIFLDNSGNPQGDFQWVVVEANITANPTNGTPNGTPKFSNMTAIEKAWFLDKQTVSIKPSAAYNALFTSLNGGTPTTENGLTDVSTGSTFEIGLSKDGPAVSYTYNNTSSRSIRDWKLDNNSSGNAFSWYYRSNNPIDADRPYDFFVGNAFDGGGIAKYPKDPNDISKTQLQLYTQGVWKTNSVLDQMVNFEMEGSMGLADIFCPGDLDAFGYCAQSSNFKSFLRHDESRSDALEIDLGSVLPISINTITFDSGPTVQAGKTVTGTITLAKPAKIETLIGLTSNSQNATVKDIKTPVKIPKGATSATFQVLTNTNGLAPGESTTATIQALYGDGFQVQLTVKN